MGQRLHTQIAEKGIDMRTIGILLAMFLVAMVFWNTILIYPIKVFVVVLHEFSHGLAAILVGGSIESIEISQRIGGLCRTRIPPTFFARFLVSSAGYLGSIFWGGLILIIAARTKYDNIMGMIIGGFLILLSLLYIRTAFGFVFTAGFGIALILISYFAKNIVTDTLMKFLGMTSCLYVIIDIKEDLIDRSGIGSDADSIAQLLGFQGLSIVVGVFWILLALFSFGLFLWISSTGEKTSV